MATNLCILVFAVFKQTLIGDDDDWLKLMDGTVC